MFDINKIKNFINDYNKDINNPTFQLRYIHNTESNPKCIAFILFSEINNRDFGFFSEYNDNDPLIAECIIDQIKEMIHYSNTKVNAKLVFDKTINRFYFIDEKEI